MVVTLKKMLSIDYRRLFHHDIYGKNLFGPQGITGRMQFKCLVTTKIGFLGAWTKTNNYSF